jgi:hypothetical protein
MKETYTLGKHVAQKFTLEQAVNFTVDSSLEQVITYEKLINEILEERLKSTSKHLSYIVRLTGDINL